METLLSARRQMQFTLQRFGVLTLTFGLIALSFAIFNWGLQYKLSLYLTSPATASHAPAKLWLGKTSAPAAAVELPQQQYASAVVQTALVGLLPFLCSSLNAWARLDTPWKLLPVQAALCAFFFRPPPSLA
jgi:hypothetical protein